MAEIPGRPQDLPEFEKPPLIETVFSLQFEPLTALTTPHVGLLWKSFAQFPAIEEHPPLTPVAESFQPPLPARMEVMIEEKPPLRRVWFLNETKTELIQLQADRFIHNWRQREGFDLYPRYERIRDHFRDEVKKLEQFLGDHNLGELRVNQCELTYLNHIERAGVWQKQGELQYVLRNWSPWPAGMFLPEPEDARLHLRFIMRDNRNQPIGRLHASLQPAWKKIDNSPILVLNMTARGAPLSEGIEGAFSFFDLGREWIVKGFAEITTPEMQRAWGRSNA